MFEHLNLAPNLDGDLWLYRSGPVNRMHHHEEIEFNLITSGTGFYILSHRRYQLRKGDLVWLFPSQEHVLVKETNQFEMWIGVMKPTAIDRLARSPELNALQETNPEGDFCRRLEQAQASKLEALFVEISAAREPVNLFNAGLAYALLSAWRQFECAADIPFRDLHPAVEQAARLLRSSSESQTLEEIAGQAGLSAARLSTLFKRQTGMPLAEFRSRQRIERFFRLYGMGQRMTMITAALEAGFGSYPQFYRVFTRLTGQSPNTYRRRLAAD
jgi:AraC-like DNA-binding protein/quercetin dioxygenase-like cupin family protein